MGLKETIVRLGIESGFDIVRFTTADAFTRDEAAALKRIRDGHMDGYSWYTEDRVRRANRPQELLQGAKSVISLALSYNTGEPKSPDEQPRGKIARYAWGDDYHDVIKKRLRDFTAKLPDIAGRPVNTRIFVDDGPMNDRAAAARAGIGWFGKNTNILTQSHGSWVFLAQVITDIPLEPDAPLKKTCGQCSLCIPACPTDAIVAPYVIDNKRCISYLTIELARRNPARTAPACRRLGIRLRHLPGCLPRQPQGARQPRTRIPAAPRLRRARAHTPARPGPSSIQRALPPQPNQARQAHRPPAQRLRRARQHRRPSSNTQP